MKIGEWDNLGRARALLQRQMGELDAAEYATHVSVNADSGRLRVLVACDVGLLDYSYAPMGGDPSGPWILRGQVHRWTGIRGLRLQTDAQLDPSEQIQEVWRMVAEDPKIELSVTSENGAQAIEGLLAFARACLQHGA